MPHAFKMYEESEGIVSCPELDSEQFYIFPCAPTFDSVQGDFGDCFWQHNIDLSILAWKIQAHAPICMGSSRNQIAL